MDNATHAFAGMMLADATSTWIERRTGVPLDQPLRRTLVALGIVAAELPDADLLYSGPVMGMGKLGYLLHHRGHTHTVVFAVASALLMWWLVLSIRQRNRVANARERLPLLVLTMAGTLSHLLLDFTNSYGVHPFWPIDNRWVFGDSVFIVEPWLWVVAIPPLLLAARRTWTRVVLSLLLCAILAASWTLGQMPQQVALVLILGAALWCLAQFWIRPSRRVWAGVLAWGAIEAVFTISSDRARAMLRNSQSPDETVVDIVLTPGAANPLCFDALIVSLSATAYRVRSASVAPWTNARVDSRSSRQACRLRAATSRFLALTGAVALPSLMANGVTWGEQWSAPRSELLALASSRCEVAAAMRYMRVPVWQRESDGATRLSDARFGAGAGGFAEIRVSAGPCPFSPRVWIPPWTPPRAETLAPGSG